MKIIKTNFKDLKIYQKQSFKDQRGYTRELFNNKFLNKKFPFDLISLSKKNVIRGLHFQIKKPQGKFITVLRGKIFDVAVDCRRKSKTFGRYFSIILCNNLCKFNFFIIIKKNITKNLAEIDSLMNMILISIFLNIY